MGDAERGYILELLLTKLRYTAGAGQRPEAARQRRDKSDSVCLEEEPSANAARLSDDIPSPSSSGKSESCGLQIISMSATVPNVGTVGKWLNVSRLAGPYTSASSCKSTHVNCLALQDCR